ncbi:MAG: DUF4383 domain-containing protein [Actinomycetota bacterium]|nr:DUF4383 domain-containing protein [Actinomycetota bacterium]
MVQRFAQVLGAVYLLVGIVGFVPPLLVGSVPGALGPFTGFLLGLFAVNWFHSLAHLAIGAAGLAVHRSFSGSKAYALALGIAYGALFLLGILSGEVVTLGGLLPLNGVDDVLHVLTALVAFTAYFTARLPEPEQGAAQPRA